MAKRGRKTVFNDTIRLTILRLIEEGMRFVGIEREPEYTQIAEKRIYHAIPKATKQYAKELGLE